MENIIEWMMALSFLVLGLSLIIRTQEWIDWIQHIKARGSNAALVIGTINLLLGSFIVSFHWDWEGISAIATLFGCIFLFRGFVLTLYPNVMPIILERLGPTPNGLIKISGALLMVVSATLFYNVSALNALLQIL